MMNAAANLAEHVLGHVSTANTVQPKGDSQEQMQALMWYGPRDVRVGTAPKPMVTDPQDAIIRVTATTLCGSDLHLMLGEVPNMKSGDILGHECMGIVESVGPEVTQVAIGDRVVVSFNIACGTCDYCQRQEYTCCDVTNRYENPYIAINQDMYCL